MNMNDFVKPVVGGAVAAALDNLYLKNTNVKSNIYFGATVGTALYFSKIVNPLMPVIIPAATLSNGKTLEDRVVEIASASVGSYTVNKYILKNDFRPSDMYQKLGVIVVADFVGEYASDYFNGQALSYFA